MSRNYNRFIREKNLEWITEFLEEAGLSWKFINGDWHIRVEGELDIFPTRKRYHFIPTDERGGFRDYEHLGEIILELTRGTA